MAKRLRRDGVCTGCGCYAPARRVGKTCTRTELRIGGRRRCGGFIRPAPPTEGVPDTTCRDCGNDFESSKEVKLGAMGICDACATRRETLLTAAEAGRVDTSTFEDLQRCMAGGAGTAKRAIDAALARTE